MKEPSLGLNDNDIHFGLFCKKKKKGSERVKRQLQNPNETPQRILNAKKKKKEFKSKS